MQATYISKVFVDFYYSTLHLLVIIDFEINFRPIRIGNIHPLIVVSDITSYPEESLLLKYIVILDPIVALQIL